jgi:cytochrome b561
VALYNSTARYGTVAMTLHWLIAIAIVMMLIGGKYMHGLPNSDPNKFLFYQIHKSMGLTILALSVARIVWRLTNVVPPLPAAMPAWQRWGSHLSHFGFYVLIIAIPLTGWGVASTSSSGVPTVWFGLFEVPNLPGLSGGEEAEEAHELFEEMHELLGNLMILLLLVHVGAALKHHFWDRDTVFRRMLPFTKVE